MKDPSMIRPAVFSLLALLIAAPASAQNVESGLCNPHRQNEVRCLIHTYILTNSHNWKVSIQPVANRHSWSATAETYISTCGYPGVMIGRTTIRGTNEQQVATFRNDQSDLRRVTQAAHGFCVETFLTNCTANGEPTNCQQLLYPSHSRFQMR